MTATSQTPVADLLITNAAELITCAGSTPRRGSEQGQVGAIARGAVAARAGRIIAVGSEDEVTRSVVVAAGATHVDAQGGLVAPGFVDPHTHPVFAGYREAEFNRILRGESYEDIARGGGGIRETVAATRRTSTHDLVTLAASRLDRMLLYGTTTAEAKSGYGLTVADERRSLEAIRDLGSRHAVELVPTNLAGHALPAEFAERRSAYVDLVVREILPATADLARFCDVFCDPSAFTPAESRRILLAGRELGLTPRIHADEFGASGGAELAAELGAISADHLGGVTASGIERLAEAGVIAVLLPGTLFFLGKKRYAPARDLIARGVPVAVGTDFNPGTSHNESMQMAVQLACLMMRMTVEEALIAATLNAAHALGIGDRVGSLEVGKDADIVIYGVPNRFHLVYHYGINHVSAVFKRGRRVVSGGQIQPAAHRALC